MTKLMVAFRNLANALKNSSSQTSYKFVVILI